MLGTSKYWPTLFLGHLNEGISTKDEDRRLSNAVQKRQNNLLLLKYAGTWLCFHNGQCHFWWGKGSRAKEAEERRLDRAGFHLGPALKRGPDLRLLISRSAEKKNLGRSKASSCVQQAKGAGISIWSRAPLDGSPGVPSAQIFLRLSPLQWQTDCNGLSIQEVFLFQPRRFLGLQILTWAPT